MNAIDQVKKNPNNNPHTKKGGKAEINLIFVYVKISFTCNEEKHYPL